MVTRVLGRDDSHPAPRYRVKMAVESPCLSHWVRIRMVWRRKEDAPTVLQYLHPHPVPSATRAQLSSSRRQFVPAIPAILQTQTVSPSTALLSWRPSPCTDHYAVWLTRAGQEQEARLEQTAATRLANPEESILYLPVATSGKLFQL